MEYFYSKQKTTTAAHLWNNGDTYCKMLSTGGMRAGNKKVHKEIDSRRICLMCTNNYNKEQGLNRWFSTKTVTREYESFSKFQTEQDGKKNVSNDVQG
jgi:hypothetical protein